jgi:predicted metalloprotease with PDZ domain
VNTADGSASPPRPRSLARFGLTLLAGLSCGVSAQPAQLVPMRIDVDATQVTRRLIHSHLQIPVSGANVTLSYPLWNPGDHAPFQHVGQIGGLVFHAGDRVLQWRRDLVDADAFHVDVPPEATTIEADFDFVLPVPGDALADSSEHMLILRWNLYVLYVAGAQARATPIEAAVTLPKGWQFATALPVERQAQNSVRFDKASLETLIDSPLLCGEFMRRFALTQGQTRAQEMDVAAESEGDLPSIQEVVPKYRSLVVQARSMFGAEHFRSYHFLVAASNFVTPGAGFEHLESSDTRLPGNFFREPLVMLAAGDLLPHEYAHSWNGKFRHPADLYPADYQAPEKTDLLWVYESLTDYLGNILVTRSGLRSNADSLEYWAAVAAKVEHETGRTWRSMQDTADSVPVTMTELFLSPPGWDSWLRALDYYDEGALVWLEANAIIAQVTRGQRSLDDFLRLFYGRDDGPRTRSTYTEQDVLSALQEIAPYDWSSFFRTRLNSLSERAPLGGLERSGWRLIYDAQPNSFLNAARRNGLGGTMYSVGIAIGTDGAISDVLRGGPADMAGFVPGMKVSMVNGEEWTPTRLVAAIAETRRGAGPIRLQTRFAGVTHELALPYRGGARYPHLERLTELPDLLTPLFAPLRD